MTFKFSGDFCKNQNFLTWVETKSNEVRGIIFEFFSYVTVEYERIRNGIWIVLFVSSEHENKGVQMKILDDSSSYTFPKKIFLSLTDFFSGRSFDSFDVSLKP